MNRVRSIKRYLPALILTLAGSLFAVGMAQQSTITGAFDVGPGGAPEVFNPLQATAGFTWLEKYYSKLVLYDVDFAGINGELAESWEISEDGTEYVFTLRDGVTWHDGEPFTAEDVKFTLELVANPDSASWLGSKYSAVANIEVVDDSTVAITLAEPDAAFLDALTFLVMLPEHHLAGIPAAELIQSSWWSENPVGTGPFQWDEYVPGQYVQLEAFQDYWRGAPQVDRLINRYYPEAASAVIALRSGEIQFTYVSSDDATALLTNESVEVIPGPSQVANFLGFDLTDERFQDKRVRQAFLYAIDRPAIVEALFGGAAIPVPCVFHNEVYIPDSVNSYAQDTEMARSLLTEAGWDFGSSGSVEVTTYYGDQLSADVLVTIQQMLSEAGINMTIRTVDVPTFIDLRQDPESWEIFYAGAANGPDPAATSIYFTSTGSANNYNISDERLDTLYAQGQLESDPAQRSLIYQEICQVLNEEAYWATMWVSQRFGAASERLNDFVWTPAPGGGRYYDAAHEWSIE